MRAAWRARMRHVRCLGAPPHPAACPPPLDWQVSAPPPAAQVRDTVDLFHFRRHRKLSLRFLASYILGSTIQVGARGASSHA